MVKKTKKHSRRRRMRGGGEWLKPWTWGTPGVAAAAPPAVVADTIAKPVVDAVATPEEQAKILGMPAGAPDAAPVPPPSAGGRRRRRTRKHRRH